MNSCWSYMKKIFSLLAFFALVCGVSYAQLDAAPVDAPDGGAFLKFESMVIDYGEIEQGSDPLRVFKFENTGDAPAIIKNAKGSCGCTVPEYPKAPIMPGETSEIKVRYATNRVGPFTKTITLTTNEGDDVKGMKRVLTIKGKVTPKPAEPAGVPSSSPSILNGGGQ